jgi:hypothetical protein
VVEEIRPFVAAGLRHVVIWNVGPLASGAGAGDVVRLALLIRRLRKLPLVRADGTGPAARAGVAVTSGS